MVYINNVDIKCKGNTLRLEKHQGGAIMKISPITTYQNSFRGNVSHNQNLKRYCEPRTGVYYYYNENKLNQNKSNTGVVNFIRKLADKFVAMSEASSSSSISPDFDGVLYL